MRTTLEELWYGNISPNTFCHKQTKETKELMEYIATHYENLQSSLNEKQKEIFEKFNDCFYELADINEREIFVYAFKLGAKIAIESMELNI